MSEISSKPVYTIGIAAKLLDVSVHLLRVYEKEGLILPFKTESGHRHYSDLEIEKVRCIRRMIVNNGMNFEGIRRMLALVPCWKLRNCTGHEKGTCSAAQATDMPCWSTEEKCSHPLPDCRDCIVYKSVVDCEDLKQIIFG